MLAVRHPFSLDPHNLPLLVSLIAHLVILILIVRAGYKGVNYHSTIETTVFFESPQSIHKETKARIVASGSNKSIRISKESELEKRPIDFGDFSDSTRKRSDSSQQEIKQEKTSLKRYITQPDQNNLYKSDLKGYLKGDHRLSAQPKTKSISTDDLPETGEIPTRKLGRNVQKESTNTGDRESAESIESNLEAVLNGNKTDSVETALSSAQNILQKKKDLIAYRNILSRLITANWTVPPVTKEDFQVLVEATIDREGNLVKTRVVRSSGLAILDAAAERAIRVSIPFPKLPSSLNPETRFYVTVLRFTPDNVGN